ncbi:hypothetical protein S40293_04399 [Stachybotrys chartarum IBT 40293]|nr:hypothetical protein S40293_04399 [Stachybotrys chartarum IBT 40293]
MKAVVNRESGHAELVSDQPLPALPEDHILVKVEAVALNPIDWMKIDNFHAPGAIQGADYSGIVQDIGPAVEKKFEKGDRVFGFVRGGDSRRLQNGAFAEYIVAKGDIQFRIPQGMSFEDAASIGSGSHSAGMALYRHLGLQKPYDVEDGKGKFVLIYGGSTSSGMFGVQLAAISGYKVIATCSAANADFVKSLGARKTFDYKDPDCGRKVREHTQDSLTIVWDTVAQPSSAKICAEAMSSKGGRYCCNLPVEFPRSDVKSCFYDATTVIGEYFEYGRDKVPVPADSDAFQFGKKWTSIIDQLLVEGKLKPHAIEIGPRGLDGVLEGVNRLRNREVSGRKLVYRIADTPGLEESSKV